MKGLILINAYSSNEEYLYQPTRLQAEFQHLGVSVDIQKNDRFPFMITDGTLQERISGYDFCIFLDKDKYVLQGLSMTGIPLFNSAAAIMLCDDKMLTYFALAGHGIPLPKTLPGLLCYNQNERIKDETVAEIEAALSYPLIVKESYGSLGAGVYLIPNRAELIAKMDEVKCTPHLFQEWIDTSYGRDVRVVVIGGHVLGGMLRSSSHDFRSNLGQGGKGEPFPLSPKAQALACKIADILQLDYCGIDFLFGRDDELVLCEVNSNAFFYGFERATGINVARAYAEFILTRLT